MEQSYFSFELTMPVRKSATGAWASEWLSDNTEPARHFVVKAPENEADKKILSDLANNGPQGAYLYHFSDGWVAQVKVENICEREYKTRKRSHTNMCGYMWMVDSLLLFGEIRSVRTTPELQLKYLIPSIYN